MEKEKGLSVKWRMTFVLLFVCGTAALAFWMVIASIWPASALIDLQVKWFDGSYYPKFTVAIMWMIIMLCPVLVIGSISWMVKKIKS